MTGRILIWHFTYLVRVTEYGVLHAEYLGWHFYELLIPEAEGNYCGLYLYRTIRKLGMQAEWNHLPSVLGLNISGDTDVDMRRPQ